MLQNLPAVAAHLAKPSAWRGLAVAEPDGNFAYERLVCRDELVQRDRVLLFAVHRFPAGYRGAMHDHRWPLAVAAFADGPVTPPTVLYDMPFSCAVGERIDQGVLQVHHGDAWAIEEPALVRHAVHSRQPHGSINATDVTHPPTRDNRLLVRELTAMESDALRRWGSEQVTSLCRQLRNRQSVTSGPPQLDRDRHRAS